MNISKRILGMVEEIEKASVPTHFELAPGEKNTAPSGMEKKSYGKKEYKDLERGVGSMDALADPAMKARERSDEKEEIVVQFRDPRFIADAMRFMADDPTIGHPTYNLGTDGTSLSFPMWKMTPDMKERTKRAIAMIKKKGLGEER